MKELKLERRRSSCFQLTSIYLSGARVKGTINLSQHGWYLRQIWYQRPATWHWKSQPLIRSIGWVSYGMLPYDINVTWMNSLLQIYFDNVMSTYNVVFYQLIVKYQWKIRLVNKLFIANKFYRKIQTVTDYYMLYLFRDAQKL